jgi:hypothetical protein
MEFTGYELGGYDEDASYHLHYNGAKPKVRQVPLMLHREPRDAITNIFQLHPLGHAVLVAYQ